MGGSRASLGAAKEPGLCRRKFTWNFAYEINLECDVVGKEFGAEIAVSLWLGKP